MKQSSRPHFDLGHLSGTGLGAGEVVGADCSRSSAIDFQWHFEDWVSSIAGAIRNG